MTNLRSLIRAGLMLAAFVTTAMSRAEVVPPTVRVMSYNIRHAEGMDGKIDPARIADVIRRSGAEIVALQEVDRGTGRTARRDLAAEIARHLGMEHFFGRSVYVQGGEYGNAVLTRHPIKSGRVLPLPLIGDGEQRTVIALTLDVHGRDVLLLATHLDHRDDDAERRQSVALIKTLIAEAGDVPVFVVGDFNADPASRVYAEMETVLADTWKRVGRGDGLTFPSDAPTLRIDYLWISPRSIEPISAEVVSSLASDHSALTGTFRLR